MAEVARIDKWLWAARIYTFMLSNILLHIHQVLFQLLQQIFIIADSSSPSTSGSDTPSVTSKRHERKKFSKIPLRYPRIPKHTPLLSVPLGKPPTL